jgi:hypothetical protein
VTPDVLFQTWAAYRIAAEGAAFFAGGRAITPSGEVDADLAPSVGRDGTFKPYSLAGVGPPNGARSMEAHGDGTPAVYRLFEWTYHAVLAKWMKAELPRESRFVPGGLELLSHFADPSSMGGWRVRIAGTLERLTLLDPAASYMHGVVRGDHAGLLRKPPTGFASEMDVEGWTHLHEAFGLGDLAAASDLETGLLDQDDPEAARLHVAAQTVAELVTLPGPVITLSRDLRDLHSWVKVFDQALAGAALTEAQSARIRSGLVHLRLSDYSRLPVALLPDGPLRSFVTSAPPSSVHPAANLAALVDHLKRVFPPPVVDVAPDAPSANPVPEPSVANPAQATPVVDAAQQNVDARDELPRPRPPNRPGGRTGARWQSAPILLTTEGQSPDGLDFRTSLVQEVLGPGRTNRWMSIFRDANLHPLDKNRLETRQVFPGAAVIYWPQPNGVTWLGLTLTRRKDPYHYTTLRHGVLLAPTEDPKQWRVISPFRSFSSKLLIKNAGLGPEQSTLWSEFPSVHLQNKGDFTLSLAVSTWEDAVELIDGVSYVEKGDDPTLNLSHSRDQTCDGRYPTFRDRRYDTSWLRLGPSYKGKGPISVPLILTPTRRGVPGLESPTLVYVRLNDPGPATRSK